MKIPLNVKVGMALSSLGGLLATVSVFLYAWDGWRGIKASGGENAFHLVPSDPLPLDRRSPCVVRG